MDLLRRTLALGGLVAALAIGSSLVPGTAAAAAPGDEAA